VCTAGAGAAQLQIGALGVQPQLRQVDVVACRTRTRVPSPVRNAEVCPVLSEPELMQYEGTDHAEAV